jgi:hypothetical protein
MSFGQDFLKGFIGADGLKDYAHASKTFRTNGYALAPRTKFLFHVYFNINTQIPAVRAAFGPDVSSIGLLVKTIQLPNYQVSVDVMNQYNRKRLVQSKIDYQPCAVEFHDDAGDLIRNMWYNYFAYYYKDPSQKYNSVANQNGSMGPIEGMPNGFDYNARDTYSRSRTVNDWGYVGETYNDGSPPPQSAVSTGAAKPPFFRDIRVYGFNQHKFAEYVLINPMITDWTHDTYDYAQAEGTMSNRMTIRYETVKYFSGAIGKDRPDTNVVGFGDPAYYDNIRSGLARPGSVSSILGQGGLIDAGVGIIEDLQSGGPAGLIGAVQKAGTAINTFRGKDIRAVVNQDARNAATAVARSTIPGAVRGVVGAAGRSGSAGGLSFPTPPRNGPPRNPPR